MSMQRRVITVLLSLALAAGVFVGAMVFGSAEEPEADEGHIVVFPWVPNGSTIEDPREDFGDNGPFFGTVTIQNLEDEEIDIYYAATDGLDFEDLTEWTTTSLDPYESVTVSAGLAGVEAPGGGVIVAGFMEGTTDEPARIAGVQKQASDVAPTINARTSDVHDTVGGYTGLLGHELGTQAVLPVVQVNSNWNTMIRVTNFNDEVDADATVQLRPAQGSGWIGTIVLEDIGPGETATIDLLSTNAPLNWVGSATITANTNIAAVAERAKNETNMLIMNVSQNPDVHGGTQSAPLIFDDWFSWNTGISIANLSSSMNSVTISYFDLDGNPQGSDDIDIPGNGMRFVYSPAGIENDDNGDEGFVGSAVITSDEPIVGAVDEVKYLGGDEDSGHAMSYMVDLNPAVAGESLAMPLVQRSDDDGVGDITGIQIFNPSSESVTAAIWYIDQTGTPFAGSPELITLDENEGHTSYTFSIEALGPNFQGSAIIQVLSGDGAIAAVANIVNYQVQYDGSSSYNLVRTPMAGPMIDPELIEGLSLSLIAVPVEADDGDLLGFAEVDAQTEGETFNLYAQLEDGDGNALFISGVDINFELDDDAADNAGLHEYENLVDPDDEFTSATGVDGIARASATREEYDAEVDDWLPLKATVTATINDTTITATVDIEWLEPEDEDDEEENGDEENGDEGGNGPT
jgi:hypothetical protein